MNNGLTNSIGWNLGKKNNSIHRFDPLTSSPKIGTNKSKKIEIKNEGTKYLIILFLSWIEIKINKNKEIKTKTKCFIKKE